MSKLTIVMYHYVRDLARSRFSRIKARTVEEFDRQLNHIANNYDVVSAQHVTWAMQARYELPGRALWLTFDDGFADHYATVLPRLHERGWQGSFYVPAAVFTGKVLDVHKIHFVLAEASATRIVAAIRDYVEDNQSGCDMVFEVCWVKYAAANYLDDAETVFVKTMLQTVLPQPYRSDLVGKLFANFVTCDERSFAAELYMTAEQMRMMVRMGHHFGNHGTSHEWLTSLSEEDRRVDVQGGIDLLATIGAPTLGWGMCYPSNMYDEALLMRVKECGAAYGLTANIGKADLSQHSAFELPRLDTNDLPH
jgi:peptidoglycan/xylan/chitin deacetylase (PgdA/CDA1 family)